MDEKIYIARHPLCLLKELYLSYGYQRGLGLNLSASF